MPSAPTVLFRPAMHGDAQVCADLCMFVLRREMEFLFRGLKRNVAAAEIVASLCRSEDSQFSWRHFLLVEYEGKVVAGLCVYPASRHHTLTAKLPAHLQEICGVSNWALLRLAGRAASLSLVNRELPPPAPGLYIPAGGVFPHSQRLGVASRTLEHLFQNASANGHPRVSLHVRRDNHRALALYRSLGFEEVPGRRFCHRILMTRQTP